MDCAKLRKWYTAESGRDMDSLALESETQWLCYTGDIPVCF